MTYSRLIQILTLAVVLSACTPASKQTPVPPGRAATGAEASVQSGQYDPSQVGFYFDEDKTQILRKPIPSSDKPAYERETHLVFRICLKNIYDTALQQGTYEVAFESDPSKFTVLEEGVPQRDGCFHTSKEVVLKHNVDETENYRSYFLVVRDKNAPDRKVALKKDLNVFQAGKLFEWDARNGAPVAAVPTGPVLRLGIDKLSYFYPGQKADYEIDTWAHLTLKQFSRFRFTPKLKRQLSFTLQGQPQQVEDKLWPGMKLNVRVVFVASEMSQSELATKKISDKLVHLRFLSEYETEATVGQWGEVDIPVGFAYDFSEGPLLETFTQVFLEIRSVESRAVGSFVGVFPFAAVDGDSKEVGVTDMTDDDPELLKNLERELVTANDRSLKELKFSEKKLASLLPTKVPATHQLRKPRRPEPMDPDTHLKYSPTDYFIASAAGIPKNVLNLSLSSSEWEKRWPSDLNKDLHRLLSNRLGRKDLFYPLNEKDLKPLTKQEEALRRQLRSPHGIYRAFAPLVGYFCSYFYEGEQSKACTASRDKTPFEFIGMEVLEFINGPPTVEKKFDELDMFQAMAEYFREDLTSLKTSEGQQRTTTKRAESGWDASPKFFGIGGGMGGGWSYNNGQYWHSDFAHVLDERVRGRTRQFGQLFVQIAKLYLSADVSTCLLVSPKKMKTPNKGLLFCFDQHKDGIEHNWYYVDQEQQYRGFFRPSSRNQGDRKWLKIMRGKEFYDRLKRLMKARVVLILRQSDGSINGVDHIISGALSELDQLTFQTHSLGKHRDSGIYPGVVFYRDV
ncbi:MAG: hypothetical protein KDD39_08770, partial [Bdellovibrionales bacterium]|nr:hypothetical protein [Bdellovibrionales bacterium]